MIEGLVDHAFLLFLLFCRIGGCMLFAPGMSSPRVPIHLRLFTALAITLALSPLLLSELSALNEATSESAGWTLIVRETLVGSAIGLMARFFILALQFAATAASAFVGLSGIPGVPLEEGDTGSPLATLVSSAAVMLIFLLGLHFEMLKAVIDSYQVIRLGAPFPVEALTSSMLDVLGETFLLALRLSAPFLAYGVIVNFALGIGNRFAQQLSVYHATTGAVILGGFLLFHLVWLDWIMLFLETYRSWLVEGGF